MMNCSLIDRLRIPKIFDMSVFDWVASLLGAIIIGYYFFKIKTITTLIPWLIFWTFLGVIIHKIFGIPTMLGYYLGLSTKPIRKSCS